VRFLHTFVGTLDLLSQATDRVIGFVINRLSRRYHYAAILARLLARALRETSAFGVLPYLKGLSFRVWRTAVAKALKRLRRHQLNVVIPIMPRTSNHRIGTASLCIQNVQVTLVAANEPIPPGRLRILPWQPKACKVISLFYQKVWENYLNKTLEIRRKNHRNLRWFSNCSASHCLII